jgi:hypothetical protein
MLERFHKTLLGPNRFFSGSGYRMASTCRYLSGPTMSMASCLNGSSMVGNSVRGSLCWFTLLPFWQCAICNLEAMLKGSGLLCDPSSCRCSMQCGFPGLGLPVSMHFFSWCVVAILVGAGVTTPLAEVVVCNTFSSVPPLCWLQVVLFW